MPLRHLRRGFQPNGEEMPVIQFDPRFIEIEYELWALSHLRSVLEEQITFLRDQDKRKTLAELKQGGWEHDEAEWQLASQELDERNEYVIPRFLRSPFIVSLWACYESGVKELAGYFQKKTASPLAMRDIRADNELRQFSKYFDCVLKLALDDSIDRLSFIDDVRLVRNAIAHANGQRRAMTEDQWTRVSAALTRRSSPPDDYRDVIILSPAFIQEAYDAVNGSLRDLVARARAT